MSERLSITPLGPYIGAQITGADLTRPLSDNQFEQLYHAVLRHQVVFLRQQVITPQQQRALALRFGDLHIHPVYPHAEGVEEIIVLDTHNDNPPDNDNWHTDVTFIDTPPAGAILAAKELPSVGGDTLWTSGIAAYDALSEPFRQLLSGLRAEHDFRKSFQEYKYRKTPEEHQRWLDAVAKHPPLLHPVVRTHPVSGKQALFVNEGFTTRIVDVTEKESEALLSFLFAHITKPEFQVRWRWQPTMWRFGIIASRNIMPMRIICRSGVLCTGRRSSGISLFIGQGDCWWGFTYRAWNCRPDKVKSPFGNKVVSAGFSSQPDPVRSN